MEILHLDLTGSTTAAVTLCVPEFVSPHDQDSSSISPLCLKSWTSVSPCDAFNFQKVINFVPFFVCSFYDFNFLLMRNSFHQLQS